MSANMTSSGRSGGSSRNPSLTDVGASVPDPSESGTVGLTGSTPLNKLNRRTRSGGKPLESSILTASEPGMKEGTGKEKSLRATFPSSSDSTSLFCVLRRLPGKTKGVSSSEESTLTVAIDVGDLGSSPPQLAHLATRIWHSSCCPSSRQRAESVRLSQSALPTDQSLHERTLVLTNTSIVKNQSCKSGHPPNPGMALTGNETVFSEPPRARPPSPPRN